MHESPRRSHCTISSRDQRQRNLRVGRSSERTALLPFASVFLTKLRDLFVLVCDLSHYGLGFGNIRLIGDSTCFLGSETPKLRILRSGSHLIDPNLQRALVSLFIGELRSRHLKKT